jgi:hypothetical protein
MCRKQKWKYFFGIKKDDYYCVCKLSQTYRNIFKLICMPKPTKPRDRRNTMPDPDTITQTQSFSKELYAGIVAFKKKLGLSSDQEAVRVMCHMVIEKANGNSVL